MLRAFSKLSMIAILSVACGSGYTARAEVGEVRMAAQYGLAFLPLIVMQDKALIEKRAQEAGLGPFKVTWARISGSAGMNDALLTGSIDFAAGGMAGLAILWSKTRTTLDVRGVASLTSMPSYLTTRNPNVKTIRDLSQNDRIALPAVKVSPTAIMLQMLAVKEYGDANYGHFDAMTVSLSQPDATIAMLADRSEITANFSAPPYQNIQLKNPKIRRLASTNDIMGGVNTLGVLWTTGKFRQQNPKVFGAVYAALEDAMKLINADKRGAAEIYLRLSGEKHSVDDIQRILESPENDFSVAPKGVLKYVSFMHRIGTLNIAPQSWKDLFFEDVHGSDGS